MSRLLQIQGELQDASAAIAQFEQAFAIEPNSKSVAAMLASFQKRKSALEKEFLELAKAVRADLCRYRFFSDTAQPTAAVIGTGLVDFQRMFTLAYDAIKKTPRRKPRLTADVIAESTFVFGYTFSGSLGVVLTLDNRIRTLFGSDLDAAMASIARLARARSTDEVLECGKILGVPCVNAMYRWAIDHWDASMGADIEWQQGHETKERVTLQVSDLRLLIDAISVTEQIYDEDVDVDGILVGADMKRRTFHLLGFDNQEITGNIDAAIPDTRRFEINSPHRCVLRKRVRVFYSTQEQEHVSRHSLIAAVPIENQPNDSAKSTI